jgi:hypothetical protein
MNTVTSADGTTIAYDRTGGGPPLILVDGAFCGRAFGPMPALAPLLEKHFTSTGTTGAGAATAETPCRTRWSGRSRTSRR